MRSSAGIREVLMLDRDEQLKVSSVGLKLFERQEAKVSPLHCNQLVLQHLPSNQQAAPLH